MANILIQLNNKEYPVQCEDDQKDIINTASNNLKERFEKLKKLSPSASNEYIILLCALSLESELMIKPTANSNMNQSNDINHKNLENTLNEILGLTESLKNKITT